MKLDAKLAASVVAIFALVALVSGCAVAPDLHQEVASMASKKPCCTSEQALPRATPLAEEQEVELSPESPHFDFGTGLAPFTRLELSPKTTSLEILAHPTGSGKLFGGDGLLHYANFTAIFYDATGSRLPSTLSEPWIKPHGGLGGFHYFADVDVPAGARTVVVTTRIDTIGEKRQGFTAGSTMIRAGAAFIPVGGGTATLNIALGPYGTVIVVANAF